jgi:hypothetical protein
MDYDVTKMSPEARELYERARAKKRGRALNRIAKLKAGKAALRRMPPSGRAALLLIWGTDLAAPRRKRT